MKGENEHSFYLHNCDDAGNSSSSKQNEEKILSTDLKISIAGVSGNVLEWYDFATFGYFSDIIGDNFFPPDQEGNNSLIETFGIFGVAFLARPIGAAIIGKIGDKHGRKGALEISIFLMAFPTFALGCLPTFSVIGWFAPFILMILRILQGLSVGGQIMASVVFTLERTPKNKWGFWGSTVFAASGIGVTLGSMVSAVLRETLSIEELRAWGWRIPFLFGALGALPGAYLKFQTEEEEIVPSKLATTKSTQNYENHEILEQQRSERNPLKDSFSKRNRPGFIAGILIPTLPSAAYYIIFVWLAIYMETILDPPVPHAFAINSTVGLVGGILFTLLGGWLTDIIGAYIKIMFVSGALLGILSPIALGLIGGESEGGEVSRILEALILQLILSLLLAIFCGAMLPWMVLQFPPEVRLTSTSLGYNIAISIWGGFSPAMATILIDQINNNAPGFLITLAAIISLIGLWIAPDLDEELDTNRTFSAEKDKRKDGTVPVWTMEGENHSHKQREIV